MTISSKSFACAKASAPVVTLVATIIGSATLALPPSVSASNRAISHAPIGVMADHTHDRGEWMFSYRAMHMEMQGSRDGTSSISPAETVTTVPNRLAGTPGQPQTLRVVPTEMTMTMHMLGVMYAPHDRVTLMAMLSVLDNEMDHTTFMGGAGTNELGTFTTNSNGFGDSQLSALTRLAEWGNGGRLHSQFGVSIPTGDITETDQILTPMGTTPSPRLPYPMQLGSGTWDILTGLTYVRETNRQSYGGQWQSTFRTGTNDEDYRLGDMHKLTAWYSWSVAPQLSVSGRVAYRHTGNIRGADPLVVAPVQTADPNNQGGDVIELGVGANTLLGGRHRIGLELLLPVHRDLNGPQLETDWMVTLGYQIAVGE